MTESLPRSKLFASEMPQAFAWNNLLVAYQNATDEDLEFGTECLALVKKYSGCRVKMLEVDPNKYYKVICRLVLLLLYTCIVSCYL